MRIRCEHERHFAVRVGSDQCLLTNRAGMECCRQVGRNARPVTQMAAELGVCWDTVVGAVREHGEPLVEDPERVEIVRALGVDETTWLSPPRITRRSMPPAWSTSTRRS